MNTLETAQTFHDLSISCIPIRALSKRPAIGRWQPYTERLPREAELRAWFASGERNIAILTGGKRGLVVVDFDDAWQYSHWLAGLTPALAKIALATYRVKTRRGMHHYFYADEPTQGTSLIWDYCPQCCQRTLHRRIPSQKKQVACQDCERVHDPVRIGGIDIKAVGGYVIAAPSIHPTGHIYRAIGHPSHIQRIESVRVLLPELGENVNHNAPRRLKRQAPQIVNADDLDALDAAMIHNPMWAGDPENGAIARIKATWTFDDLLGSGNGHRRGVTMVNCPLHHDTAASLAIYPDGHAHCFGAGGACFHGDVIDLHAAMNNLTISESIQAMLPAIAATRQ